MERDSLKAQLSDLLGGDSGDSDNDQQQLTTEQRRERILAAQAANNNSSGNSTATERRAANAGVGPTAIDGCCAYRECRRVESTSSKNRWPALEQLSSAAVERSMATLSGGRLESVMESGESNAFASLTPEPPQRGDSRFMADADSTIYGRRFSCLENSRLSGGGGLLDAKEICRPPRRVGSYVAESTTTTACTVRLDSDSERISDVLSDVEETSASIIELVDE